ncbi:MAG: hypothetical protein ICV79_29010, partial [Flavisolibacter sp.]|nr:hypothetical protein [Flavisolibacter sp.]
VTLILGTLYGGAMFQASDRRLTLRDQPVEWDADANKSIVITLPGAVLLALVGILPGIAQRLGVTQGFSTFFGGTSLLIMVGVILDTLQQIETQLLMRQYDGLMKSGRIQGRQTVTQASF